MCARMQTKCRAWVWATGCDRLLGVGILPKRPASRDQSVGEYRTGPMAQRNMTASLSELMTVASQLQAAVEL